MSFSNKGSEKNGILKSVGIKGKGNELCIIYYHYFS